MKGILQIELDSSSKKIVRELATWENNIFGSHITIMFGAEKSEVEKFIGSWVSCVGTSIHHDTHRMQVLAVDLPEDLKAISNRQPHVNISTADEIKPVTAGEILSGQYKTADVDIQLHGTIVFKEL